MLERKENDIMMIKGMAGEYCDDDEQFAKISHFVCLAEHEAEKYEKEHNTEIINYLILGESAEKPLLGEFIDMIFNFYYFIETEADVYIKEGNIPCFQINYKKNVEYYQLHFITKETLEKCGQLHKIKLVEASHYGDEELIKKISEVSEPMRITDKKYFDVEAKDWVDLKI